MGHPDMSFLSHLRHCRMREQAEWGRGRGKKNNMKVCYWGYCYRQWGTIPSVLLRTVPSKEFESMGFRWPLVEGRPLGHWLPPLTSVSESPCSRQNVWTFLLSAFTPAFLIHSWVYLVPNFLTLHAVSRPCVSPF